MPIPATVSANQLVEGEGDSSSRLLFFWTAENASSQEGNDTSFSKRS